MRASGSSLRQPLVHVLDGLHFVVQEIDLPAALQFAQHGFADHALAVAADEGLDREALLRRGGDHREVAQAFERHRQRARDRRGGQRQHVDLGAQRLQRFLLAHAEAVFLVDDDQAEALELDVLLQQLVRADDDVDLAFGQRLHVLRLLLRRAKARQFGDLDRPSSAICAKRSEKVWKCCSASSVVGHEHRDLLAVADRDEGGAQGDFGLAEADVAADQAVHRLARAHVVDHGAIAAAWSVVSSKPKPSANASRSCCLISNWCPWRAARWA